MELLEYTIEDTIEMSKYIAELKQQGIMYFVKATLTGWLLTIY